MVVAPSKYEKGKYGLSTVSTFHNFKGKNKMTEADFKKYADQELVKCQRYKQVWKNATNPAIKDKAFFNWCIIRFQLLQIHIYSPEHMTPFKRYSMDEAVGYF